MTYEQSPLGRLIPSTEDSGSSENNATLRDALLNLAVPVCVTDEGVNTRGTVNFDSRSTQGVPLTGLALPLPLERCGDLAFCTAHGVRYPMVGGSHGQRDQFSRHGD